ncbi:unnamed protein product [Lepeophtheirus salmonis]|uniref:UDP-GalNAc:beta-1,3-N-acetylgalactosaminyltransferase 2 n=1 Tax=Lepeophtheirus salmonis TaxID=72036 RepID=A0A7R8CJP7_LEPSM|nr:uncharacterized protein LOC121125872 isoform X2 [Lepeophtheirus salmonis]CAB4057243.1 unnamed protein product [Lepeophtheirus salmonis]CAF2813021.1 unnamed protein product [Lepeophtheirus salmonis]
MLYLKRLCNPNQFVNICILGLVFSITANYIIDLSFISDIIKSICDGNSRVKLVIGVLSRSEHLAKRRSIRSSWKSMEFDSVRTFFILGDTACRIDPYWRIRESRCYPWQVFVPVNTNENEIIKLYRVQPSLVRPGEPFLGLGFQIKFPIAIISLGVSKRLIDGLIKSGADLHDNYTLSLEEFWAKNNEGALSHINFTLQSLQNTVSDDGFVYLKAQGEELSLSRLFEGYVRLSHPNASHFSTFNSALKRCNLIWNKIFGDDGIVIFRSLVNEKGKFIPFKSDSCPLVSFLYQVPDLYELRNVINTRSTQNKCHINKNENIASKLVEEVEDFDDIIFIPDIHESTENFPQLSLAFFERIINDIPDFDYILLTNDETFIATDQVIPKVQMPSEFTTWRSNFAQFSSVSRYGVTPDLQYIADSYPLRPSESGSILSKELVHTLARLRGELISFGEMSASLSVWLAPFNLEYKDDQDFIYGNQSDCSSSTSAYGPLNPESMIQAWKNYLECDQICSCP